MPPYLLPIHIEECAKCGRKATVRLFNSKNAPCGSYCDRCGKAELKELESNR